MRDKIFYVAQSDSDGLNGWTAKEMSEIWFDKLDWGGNVYFNYDFANLYYNMQDLEMTRVDGSLIELIK